MRSMADDKDGVRRINLARLPKASRAAAWAFIQRNRPELAEFLKSESYRLLRDGLGCEPILTLTKKELGQIHGQH